MVYFEMEHLTHHVLDRLNSGITKFHNLMTIGTDQMVVLLETVRFLVLRQILAKLVLGDQVAVYQHVQRVIDRGTADPVLLVFHADVQLVDVEVIAAGVDFLQYRKSLGRFAQTLVFKISRQDLSRGFQIVLGVVWHNKVQISFFLGANHNASTGRRILDLSLIGSANLSNT